MENKTYKKALENFAKDRRGMICFKNKVFDNGDG